MKWIMIFTFLVTISSCSKSGPESATGELAPTTEESRELISQESLSQSKDKYNAALRAFRDSADQKLAIKKEAFEAYQKEVKVYLNLLTHFPGQASQSDKVTSLFESDLVLYSGIKNLIKKLNDSRASLEKYFLKIKEIKKQTGDFQLSRITELGLRETLLENIDSYKQDSTFLTLTFDIELTQLEIDTIKNQKTTNNEIQEIFTNFSLLREVLQTSENTLTQVDFSFDSNDHTTAALTYERKFFKTLEEHIRSINTFKSDASIYLDINDLKELNQQIEIINLNLTNLKELKKIQEEIGSDLSKIIRLGYDFPNDIANLKEDQLKWKTKEVYVYHTTPLRGVWQIGYHIVGPRHDARPIDIITLERHYYKLVTKATYPAFDDAFGTAFTRIIMYLSSYEGKFSKEVHSRYINIDKLLLDTYTIVTDYIDAL